VVVGGRARDKAGGKTHNADKTISIDRATVAALRKWSELQVGEREFFGADYHPGDYVFTFEDGRPPHPDTIRQRFDRLAAAAGLSRITFHDLRHSYATGALKAGVSPKVVSERIGHADVGFFLQTYAHVLKNDDRDAAEQAASFLIGDGWENETNDAQS
jgi:integrase